MAERNTPYTHPFSVESQRVEGKPIRGYDNSARGAPVNPSETSITTYGGRSDRVENSAPTVPGLENLTIDPRLCGPEHIDAADFYRFNSRQTPGRYEVTSPPRPQQAPPPPPPPPSVCKICLVTSCVMNGGSREAQRLRSTIAAMKAARSKAQMLVIGLDYMNSYTEAYDNVWRLDTPSFDDGIKENLSVPDGKLLAETSKGLSPISVFTTLGKSELVAVLIHEGADVNHSVGGRGPPLLHAATWLGNEDTLEILLSAGADPNSMNERGLTALHVAVASGNIKAVKILIGAGADPDLTCKRPGAVHSFPIFSNLRDSQIAAYLKIIDFLVESGASTDPDDKTKWTPLQYVCICGSVKVARRLIEIGVPKAPLVALRQLVTKEWTDSGYYKAWAGRLAEKI
ncbi:hypothetical protein TWF718_010423 [Orbilia javanica]|uniref:Uncharacterized protein n=1 Tax=Orbilia javanica TaxID=47235 RepID=A0AAN8MI15_9PEZI